MPNETWLSPGSLSEDLKLILNSLDEGIHIVNKDGVTVFYNEAAAGLDNLRPEEVIGRHILTVFPSLSPHTSTLLSVLKTGVPVKDRQQTFTNFKGHTITTVNTTLPISVDGHLVGAVEVSRNITVLRSLAERVADLTAELYGAGKAKPSHRRPAKFRAVYTFDDMIGGNPEYLKAKRKAERAAASTSPVLVVGETGTGKEVFVQSIHNLSARADGPFIAQNCAALPEALLEGILFGTVRGAFTGASDRPGLFEVADGGTLFLDEIDSMPVSLQAKLLRVIQESKVRRVGDHEERQVDVRIISAISTDPLDAVERGMLRIDLYYRLNVIQVVIPPLRTRSGDIPLLVSRFIEEYNARLGRTVTGVDEEARNLLMSHSWPGNVRELKHAIEAAMNALDEGEQVITARHLPHHILRPGQLPSGLEEGSPMEAGPLSGARTVLEPARQPGGSGLSSRAWAASASGGAELSGVPAGAGGSGRNTQKNVIPEAKRHDLRIEIGRLEAQRIQEALARSGGNLSECARLLGMPRQTLQYRLKKYGITRQGLK